MSTSAPPRATASIPYAETQPQQAALRGSRDWLPVLGWFVDDGVRHSRVDVIPCGNTVDPNERFVTVLNFFRGKEEPIYTYISDSFAGDDNFRYESHELLRAIREPTFEGLVEITARSLD